MVTWWTGSFLQAEKAYLSLAHTDAEVDGTVSAFAEAVARYAADRSPV